MNTNINPKSMELIADLSNAFGPSGFEDAVFDVAKKHCGDIAQVTDDCLRNIYIRPNKPSKGGPVFMLDAHCDEVGFMVHSIRPNGTLRFVSLGGWNMDSLPSSKVLVRNAEGRYLPGLIASKPVHFKTAAERTQAAAPAISDYIIDVGATSAQEAAEVFKIRIGEPIVSDVQFQYDEEHDVMIGKGFDCRIGCAALIEAMHRLQDEELEVDVVGVLSSQEEVGERGVKVAVNKVRPQIAICFEGCPADDTFTEPYAIQTALKKGPMIRFMDKSIICNPRYQRYALDLAEKQGLAIQASVREGGGNNGAMVSTALDGIPVIVVGVPVRYIHSHYGITSYYDFEATVQLAVAIVKSMNAEIIKSF